MDNNRTLIAFGMLLALVAFALQKQTIDGDAVEKIVTFLAGGITGAMNPLAGRAVGTTRDAVRTAAALLLIFGVLVLHACGHGPGPDPNAPTAPPPSVTLPKDPLAPPFTPFYRTADGGIDR